MCGIIGYTGEEIRGRIEVMGNLIAHRGPDDEGKFAEAGINLLHKRLSIIDLKNGRQPQISRDGRFVIIYNGEIYNFKLLREKLEQVGHKFDTQSDTEVLMNWCIEYGTDGLTELNGMFAFVLWDRREKSLLLVRDRLGIKPLYYTLQGGRLIFGSEIKGLLPWLSNRRPNFDAIFEFMTFQNILGNHTFFSDVNMLPAGSWLRFTPNGFKTGNYWDISLPRNYRGDIVNAVDEFREALDHAIDRHLVSDVPVGSYLSGGIDSSSVSTVASRKLEGCLYTFTGAFTDAEKYDERVGSRSVARNIGAKLHEVVICAEDFKEHFEKVVWHLDEPTLGTGALPQFMVSQLVSEHVKVVLTGHGGDELFAGYQVNQAALLQETMTTAPWRLPGALFNIPLDQWSRVLYFLIYPMFQPEVKHGLFIMTPKRKRKNVFHPDFLEYVKHYDPFTAVNDLAGRGNHSAGEKLLILYLKTYLPTLLTQEDKVGMAHSIEARVPFCDNEIIELALKLPFAMKLVKGLKTVPREAMRPALPKILYSLPKRGFPTPFARWFRSEPVRSMMSDLLFGQSTRERGLFNTQQIKKMFDNNQKSRTDHLGDYALANRLYSLAIVEQWFRIFMDGNGRASLSISQM